MRSIRKPGICIIFSKSADERSVYYPRWRQVARAASSYLVTKEANKLLEIWLDLGDEARLPGRRDIRPESMPGLLSDIWLMDYEGETARLRYRLVGENIRARYDFPLVGKYLDETLAPEAKERVLRYFLACVEKPAVSIVAGRLYHEWDRPGYGERLLLPLLDPAGNPEGLIGITLCKQVFESRPEAEERAKRVTSILPLDGSPISEESS